MPHSERRGRLKAVGAKVALGVAFLLTASVVTAVPAQAAVPVNGLKGEYYALGAEPAYEFEELTDTVLDGEINYSNLVPVFQERVGQGENAGVRWTGTITAPTTGDYTFYAIGDNGMRLWVDNTQIIDFWVNVWDEEQTSTTVTLNAGEQYDFRLDNFQATGGANMFLRWEGPGIEKSIVPLEAFSPPADFDVFAAEADVAEAGDSVQLNLGGDVAGVEDLAEHLLLSVDQSGFPIEGAALAPGGQGVTITPGGPITAETAVRLSYDGTGSFTLDGEAVPAFDIPVRNNSTYVMTTPWAEDVDADNPLPEYPRPQLVREDWVNLNGRWQFDAATADSPTPFGVELPEEVVVPYPIESMLSGLMRHEDHMVYRRTFEVPEGWAIGAGQRLQLNFGAVDYDSTVYVNGTEVVSHIGGFDAFSADITDALVAGENELVVRVTDTTGNQPRGKQDPRPSGIFYTPASGIWQTVWMEPVATTSIDRLDLVPNLETSSLMVNAVSANASDDASVTVVATDDAGAEVGRVVGAANADLSLSIPDANLWTPEDPYLYNLQVTLTDGASTDTASGYSGMRSIEVREDAYGVQKIFLNGEKTYLNSTLDQGYWPDGVYTAPTDEALAWDISTTKALGFNTIRKHIKVEPARWYYHADQIGMLVWQDMPANNGGNNDEATRDVFRADLAEMVEELGSTTSIIGWIPFNEGWGEWDRTATGVIANSVKAADPSRLVNAHSGVNCCNSKGDSGMGDIIDWHQYTGPALPRPDDTRAAIDGEHGGFSLSVPGHVWPGGSVNPYGEVDSSEELTAAYVRNTSALVGPAQDYLSGSVYTQLTDLEGEVNGFYTYDRRIEKMDRAQVRAVNQLVTAAGSDSREYPDPTPGADGIAYWPLDEAEGLQGEDVTGNGHTLTLDDGTVWTGGAAGSAIEFDGNEQSATAQIPELDTTGNYSVSAWVRMDALPASGGYDTVASMDSVSGRSLFFLQWGHPVNGFAFSFADGPRAVAPVTPELGSWHHLVGVRDAEAGNIKLYLDGELAATEATRAGAVSSGTFALGRGQWDGGEVDFLDGAVDDVRVYDGVLSAEDVAALADLTVEPTAVTPVAVTSVDVSGTAGDTFTVPAVTGVEYLVDGEVVAAGTYPGDGSVTVSAQALEGYVLAEDADAEWAFSFSSEVTDPVEPTVVSPGSVTFTDASGTAGDTFTVPAVTGVEYLVSGEVVAAGTYPGVGSVTVRAQALEGYVLAEDADAEWTFSFSSEVTDPVEPTVVSPGSVTFTDASGTAADTFTVPTVTGVEYLVSGEVVAAGTYPASGSVTVSAQALEGHVLAEDADAEWTFSFSSEVTDPTDPTDPGTDPTDPTPGTGSDADDDDLASTGANVGLAGGIAFALLALGGLLAFRRRRVSME